MDSFQVKKAKTEGKWQLVEKPGIKKLSMLTLYSKLYVLRGRIIIF